MKDQFLEALKSLDRRDIVSGVPGDIRGCKMYEFLVEALEKYPLSENQIRNLLHVLYRLRAQGTETELLRIYLQYSQDERIRVRSVAITLAIAIVRMHKWLKRPGEILSLPDLAKLRAALERGVEKQAEDYQREFLGE